MTKIIIHCIPKLKQQYKYFTVALLPVALSIQNVEIFVFSTHIQLFWKNTRNITIYHQKAQMAVKEEPSECLDGLFSTRSNCERRLLKDNTTADGAPDGVTCSLPRRRVTYASGKTWPNALLVSDVSIREENGSNLFLNLLISNSLYFRLFIKAETINRD